MRQSGPSQQLRLKDGRGLGYAEFGARDGQPVFYFHGFPGSGLDYLLTDDGTAAAKTDVRIIAPDRPGMGLSSFQRGRQILDWPADVAELADALGIERFSVLGVSGGGPYALACAYLIPERLSKTGMVCGMGPFDAPGMVEGVSWTIPGSPGIVRRLTLMMMSLGLQRDPEQFLSRSTDTMSLPDRQLLDQPDAARAFTEGLLEALQPGTGGANRDAALYTRPWGFLLQDVSTEVHLWHGGRDRNAPISVGQYVAEELPDCHPRFYDAEGHLTLPHNRIDEILGTLAT